MKKSRERKINNIVVKHCDNCLRGYLFTEPRQHICSVCKRDCCTLCVYKIYPKTYCSEDCFNAYRVLEILTK